MRIDGPTNVKTWLYGKFSGSFKGNLKGTAESASQAISASHAIQAETASYAFYAENAGTASYAISSSYAIIAGKSYIATSASYIKAESVEGLSELLGGQFLPLTGGVISGSLEVTDKLIINSIDYKGGIHTEGDIVLSGSVSEASPTGSSLRFYDTVRTKGALISYDGEKDIIQFLFYRGSSPGPGPGPDPGPGPGPEPPTPTGSHIPGTDYTDPTIPHTNPIWRP